MKQMNLGLHRIQRRGGQVQLVLYGHNREPMITLMIIDPNERPVENVKINGRVNSTPS